jgi:hypothetical protein
MDFKKVSKILNSFHVKNEYRFDPCEIVLLSNGFLLINVYYFSNLLIIDPKDIQTGLSAAKCFRTEMEMFLITCDSDYVYLVKRHRLEKCDYNLQKVLVTNAFSYPFLKIRCIHFSNFDRRLYISIESKIIVFTTNFIRVATHILKCIEIFKIRTLNDVACVSCTAYDSKSEVRFYRLPNFEFICGYNTVAYAIAVYENHFYVYTNSHFVCFDCNGNFVMSIEKRLGHVSDMIFFDKKLLMCCLLNGLIREIAFDKD